jgi:two-component system response regulator DevR
VKIIIVDDSELIRQRLEEQLTAIENVQIVGQAEDAYSAVTMIAKTHPDVVILDVRMPGGSGIDVLRAIKKEGSPPKIIMLTKYPYPQYREKCLELGADYFFDKATEFDKAIELIRKLSLEHSQNQESPKV